jgi:hypothetical protein
MLLAPSRVQDNRCLAPHSARMACVVGCCVKEAPEGAVQLIASYGSSMGSSCNDSAADWGSMHL